jgi:hypothetical protein
MGAYHINRFETKHQMVCDLFDADKVFEEGETYFVNFKDWKCVRATSDRAYFERIETKITAHWVHGLTSVEYR